MRLKFAAMHLTSSLSPVLFKESLGEECDEVVLGCRLAVLLIELVGQLGRANRNTPLVLDVLPGLAPGCT
jgi:hypothetical protein